MGSGINIMIADNNRSYCHMIKQYLHGQEEINTIKLVYNGLTAWEFVQICEPDLIILNVMIPNLDGLSVLEKINNQTLMIRPKIIMISAFDNESLTNQALKLGVDYFMLKPINLDILYKRICSLTQDIQLSNSTHCSSLSPAISVDCEPNLIVELTSIMHLIGVPAHVKGYQYIRASVLMVVEDNSLLGAVTKELYPSIALKYGTTSKCVERGIRHAIDLAWERGNADTLKRLFGSSMNNRRKKPKNTEFIALLAVKLQVMRKVS